MDTLVEVFSEINSFSMIFAQSFFDPIEIGFQLFYIDFQFERSKTGINIPSYRITFIVISYIVRFDYQLTYR